MKYIQDINTGQDLEYLKIPKTAYQDKIRCFERQHRELSKLSDEAYFKIKADYGLALFEVREYMQFLNIVDRLIEYSIEENVYYIDGKDIYKTLLSKKAVAAYFTLDHNLAKHVSEQLIRIYKDDSKIRDIYYHTRVDQKRDNAQFVRGIVILLILIAGITTGIELLIIRNIFEDLTKTFELARNTLLLSAIGIFVFHEIGIRYNSHIEILNIIKRK